MGSSSSKPSAPHIWKGSAPTGLSHDMIESLHSSNETDTSRLQAQELLVQARVASELKRLHEQETAALRETQEKISASSRDDDADGKSDVDRLSRQAVAKEIETLRRKLEARGSGLRALPESVETARSQVVRCLRENDRRPLDCWQEVERFKGEVRKLEKSWVEKVAG